MTRTLHVVLFVLVAAVAAAAGRLSFDALEQLAKACTFESSLSWLLPVTIDAGAAAGTIAWLFTTGRARRFGRALALILLAVSVTGNAVGHAVTSHLLGVSWTLVVLVATVPPAVLGAVVHLVVLLADPTSAWTTSATSPTSGRTGSSHVARKKARPAGRWHRRPARRPARPRATPRRTGIGLRPPGRRPAIAAVPSAGGDRAAGLIAAGLGRRRLAAALNISQHAAREMLRDARPSSGVAA